MQVRLIESMPPQLELSGEIDHFDSDSLKGYVLEALSKGDRLIVDMSDVTYVDSGGVAVLFWLGSELLKKQGKAAIVATNPNIRRILEIVRLTELPSLWLVGSVDEARASLQ